MSLIASVISLPSNSAWVPIPPVGLPCAGMLKYKSPAATAPALTDVLPLKPLAAAWAATPAAAPRQPAVPTMRWILRRRSRSGPDLANVVPLDHSSVEIHRHGGRRLQTRS